jgi:hypothetical protein
MQNEFLKPFLAYTEDLIDVVAGMSPGAGYRESKSTMIAIRR